MGKSQNKRKSNNSEPIDDHKMPFILFTALGIISFGISIAGFAAYSQLNNNKSADWWFSVNQDKKDTVLGVSIGLLVLSLILFYLAWKNKDYDSNL